MHLPSAYCKRKGGFEFSLQVLEQIEIPGLGVV